MLPKLFLLLLLISIVGVWSFEQEQVGVVSGFFICGTMAEIFVDLESNDKKVVENAKQKLRELFIKVAEPWLLNGLYEHYLHTNSVRCMDVLVNIKEPHHIFLFDKLSASIKSPKSELKVQALTLLGHVARNQPTWLYKLPEHVLLDEILKLLKIENELVPLISALLLLIVLLPVIPSSMGAYLPEVFEVFSRLAAWNCSPGKLVEDQMIHMQVALYALFLRLYGMYPCNLVTYLRGEYRDKNNPVFVHTIKPMLDTVRMHPSLVTASKDNETTTERWKKVRVYDVIVECERFSLDLIDRCPHDACQFTTGFRSRSGTTNSTTIETSYHLQSLVQLPTATTDGNAFFSPSGVFPDTTAPTHIPQPHIQGVMMMPSANFPSQEGTSPPEAAIEATPETTPVRDLRMPQRQPPLNSTVVRALTSFSSSKIRSSGSSNTTPTHSQPSSPMRKDYAQFNFANVSKKDPTATSQKYMVLMKERAQLEDNAGKKNIPPPTSPLRILDANGRHPRNESPFSQEDEEVSSIVARSEPSKRGTLTRCDSVLHDEGSDTNYDDEQEHGSPCTEGGLHMPNSKSMNNFEKRMQRLRYHSQCNAETERVESSTGSSPGKCVDFNNTTVRRANSCPEMKKSPIMQSRDIIALDKTDEEDPDESILNGMQQKKQQKPKQFLSCTTQTDNFWPMPYEHLFLAVFPSLESSEVKPSPIPSPAPALNLSQERYQPSIHDILDKYIETAVVSSNERDNVQSLRDQVQLVHQQLLFERHRRETHAYRNRRLLADAKSTRLLEELNSALRDQVQLNQREVENLRSQIDSFKRERCEEDKKLTSTMQYWESQYKTLQQDCKVLRDKNESLEKDLSDLRNKFVVMDTQKQQVEASLSDAIAEINVAREQAWAGEKGRTELEQVNKELLLIGELHLKYEERLSQLTAQRQSQQELDHLKRNYHHELKTLSSHLETKTVALEACQTRISDLERDISQQEELIAIQKKFLTGSNEEQREKLDAVESKYQTQLTINRALEERLLELRQKFELIVKRSVNSPDTSSCHEVNVTTTTDRTAGLSAHSSPLSTSLASSEGSLAFHDVREMKNLQALVDQKSKQGEECVDEGQTLASSSAKTD